MKSVSKLFAGVAVLIAIAAALHWFEIAARKPKLPPQMGAPPLESFPAFQRVLFITRIGN